MTPFATRLKRYAGEIDRSLDRLLAPSGPHGAPPVPAHLLDAMRHGVLNGGKRLRPWLLSHSAALFGIDRERTLNAALAVELIHCYSLIHDDLPAMDDDDLRRGLPTVHRKFGEATAILAGDALLPLAFSLLAEPACHPDPALRITLVSELAAGSGAAGMVGGQAMDLEGEKTGLSLEQTDRMQAMKTGALIRTCVRMGAILGGASQKELAALTAFGEAAGKAFQLADDILDLTASPEQMGKATNKDAARAKPTLVSRIGLEAARRNLGDTVHHALSALMMFGPEADELRATARYFAERKS